MGNEEPYGVLGSRDLGRDFPSTFPKNPIWRHLRKEILPSCKTSELIALGHYPFSQSCQAYLALRLGVQPLPFLFQPCSCLSKRKRKRLDYWSPLVARRNENTHLFIIILSKQEVPVCNSEFGRV